MDPSAWMERLQQGDREALEPLLAHYEGMLRYIVSGVLSDPHRQEDCLAEVRLMRPVYIEVEDGERLERALASLSSRDRALFYRKYYYLQSTARIAAELGLTPRAVEGRLYRIRKGLQNKLGGDLL